MSDAYDALYAYTTEHADARFILQHVVDAHAAQVATPQTKPITLTFALVGLYLHIERAYSGREVQLVHMRMARHKRQWPDLHLPADRGAITPALVWEVPAGSERDVAIESWCRSVWDAFRDSREAIVSLMREYEQTDH